MSVGAANLDLVAEWIAATPASETLRQNLWVVPTSQSVHILAISVVFVSALILNLRLLGVGGAQRAFSSLASKLSKLTWAGMVVLLATGMVQTIAEPARQFGSPAFWLKLLLITFALLITGLLHRSVSRAPQRWDAVESRPAWSKAHAVVALAIWTVIIFCGRFIAYT